MGLFDRWRSPASATSAPAQPVAPPSGESPAELTATLDDLNLLINRSAGDLSGKAVVAARRLTDTLREVIETSQVRPLDVYAVISVKGILGDYLPTTLRAYLAVDPDLRDVPRGAGLTPQQSLLAQIDALQTSATATLAAAREQDADALMTQGNFLRTKFSRSDLDLEL